jgi:hypothetical protein
MVDTFAAAPAEEDWALIIPLVCVVIWILK